MSQRGELRYEPGLDGLRGIAVLAVLLFHGGVSWAQGGFTGVEAFFVLSGFLITSLLVAEWRRDATIHLKDFWIRRARRLLPALFVVVLVCAVYETVVGATRAAPDFGAQGLSTLLYVANWHQIWTGSGYFAQAAVVSPLQHTWSLAIEEQFYLVWPLLVVGVMRVFRRRALFVLLGIAIVGFCASNLETAWLFHNGSGLDRVYYGTDTRASGILVGAALAIVLALRRGSGTDVAAASFGPRSRIAVAVAGVLGAAGYGLAVLDARGTSSWLFHGGWLAVDFAVAAMILGACSADRLSPVRAVLSSRPLRMVGIISYGLYLWHFPLMAWLTTSSTGLSGAALLWLRLGASFAVAGVSYVLVEQPIRRRRVRGPALRVVAPIALSLAVAGVTIAWVSNQSVGAAPVAGRHLASNGTCRADIGGLVGVETYHVCPPVRVMVVGDSIGLTLGMQIGMNQQDYGAIVDDAARLGCGIVNTGQYDQFGTGWGTPIPHCSSELSYWQSAERTFKPQAIVIEMGYWNELDWRQGGRAVDITQSAYRDEVAAGLHRLVEGLSLPHVPIVILSVPIVSPPPWPGGGPAPQASLARHDAINSVLRSEVARDGGGRRVSFFDIGPYVTPGNRYSAAVDGGICRSSDGVHLYTGTFPGLVRTRCGESLQVALLSKLRGMVVGRS